MANREIRIRGNNKVSSVRQDTRKIGKQLQNQERLCSPRGVAPGYGGTRFANRGKQSQHQETLFPRGVVAMVWGNKQRKKESNITDKKSEITIKVVKNVVGEQLCRFRDQWGSSGVHLEDRVLIFRDFSGFQGPNGVPLGHHFPPIPRLGAPKTETMCIWE